MVISQGNLSLKIVTYLTYSKKVTIVYVKFCKYNKNTEKVTVVAKKGEYDDEIRGIERQIRN